MFCCVLLLTLAVGLLLSFLMVRRSSSLKPQKIFGIYSVPKWNYYFKVIFFYLLVQLRKRQSKNSTKKGSDSGHGYGVKSRSDVEEMDRPQSLSEHPKAIDAVYFNAGNRDGYYMVMATARRPKSVINGLLYLRIPGIGLLDLPRMPDTLLFGSEENFSAEGLSATPQEPMKSWQLQYNGKMKLCTDPSKSFDVVLDALWTSNLDYFDFDTDMSPWALSKTMAKEQWSRQYFQDLQSAHQTHYEQMGMIRGTVTIDGKMVDLRMNSMRDHSYGHKREWKLMHRYGLHMIHTEDEYSINVGIICQPITCSRLELGYVFTPSGEKLAVSSVNLPLWQHGEGGIPPTDYAFSFNADGKEFFVEVQIEESPEFYIGWEWETRVVERMATFRVNGIKGWGIAEWNYRHQGGRPETYASKDPEWTLSLNKG
ncbi:UNVERIFIED_CONTAM: hypothetical protein RMT77_008186 [Armadillidium vulgare]